MSKSIKNVRTKRLSGQQGAAVYWDCCMCNGSWQSFLLLLRWMYHIQYLRCLFTLCLQNWTTVNICLLHSYCNTACSLEIQQNKHDMIRWKEKKRAREGERKEKKRHASMNIREKEQNQSNWTVIRKHKSATLLAQHIKAHNMLSRIVHMNIPFDAMKTTLLTNTYIDGLFAAIRYTNTRCLCMCIVVAKSNPCK